MGARRGVLCLRGLVIKHRIWNGVARSSKADISFFGRVSDKVGELIPESLVRDVAIASLLS